MTNWLYTNSFQPISSDPVGSVRWDAAVQPSGVTESFFHHCCPGHELYIPAKALRAEKLARVLRFFDLNFFVTGNGSRRAAAPAASIADNEG